MTSSSTPRCSPPSESSALPSLLLVVFVLGGILSGWFKEAVRVAAEAGVAGLEGWEEDAEVVDAAGRFVLKGEGDGGWRARPDAARATGAPRRRLLACAHGG